MKQGTFPTSQFLTSGFSPAVLSLSGGMSWYPSQGSEVPHLSPDLSVTL